MHDTPGSTAVERPSRAEKSSLRRRLVAARAAMSDDARRAAARQTRDHLLEMPEMSAAGTIAAYYSTGAEPDTRTLIFALWKRGSYVVLPILLPDGDLDWASYEGPDSLAAGRHVPTSLIHRGAEFQLGSQAQCAAGAAALFEALKSMVSGTTQKARIAHIAKTSM